MPPSLSTAPTQLSQQTVSTVSPVSSKTPETWRSWSSDKLLGALGWVLTTLKLADTLWLFCLTSGHPPLTFLHQLQCCPQQPYSHRWCSWSPWRHLHKVITASYNSGPLKWGHICIEAFQSILASLASLIRTLRLVPRVAGLEGAHMYTIWSQLAEVS